MGKIIAIVGMCGSGKSVASDYLESIGYKKVYFGGVTMEKLQESNYIASVNSLKTAKDLGVKVFFSAGSQAEYGIKTNNVLETSKCKPVTAYGKAKLKFFDYAIDYCNRNNLLKSCGSDFHIEKHCLGFANKGKYELNKGLVEDWIESVMGNRYN